MYATRIRHAPIQEGPVHCVACVVVLLDVLLAACQGVAAANVRQQQKLVTDPIEQAESSPAGLYADCIGGGYCHEAAEIS